MAQYKTHTQFNLFLALPALLLGAYYFVHPSFQQLGVFGGCFIYATLYMSPDMDLANQIKFFSVRGVLTSPFRLYSKIFRHRGLSHSVFFGTLTRIGFLCLLGILGLWIFKQILLTPDSFILFLKTHQTWLLFAFAGIFCADLCHLLLDI